MCIPNTWPCFLQKCANKKIEINKNGNQLFRSGADGMDDLIHLCNGAASMLKGGGFFAFETNGEKQSKLVKEYMESEMQGKFCRLKIVSDFAGIQRFVTAYKQP